MHEILLVVGLLALIVAVVWAGMSRVPAWPMVLGAVGLGLSGSTLGVTSSTRQGESMLVSPDGFSGPVEPVVVLATVGLMFPLLSWIIASGLREWFVLLRGWLVPGHPSTASRDASFWSERFGPMQVQPSRMSAEASLAPVPVLVSVESVDPAWHEHRFVESFVRAAELGADTCRHRLAGKAVLVAVWRRDLDYSGLSFDILALEGFDSEAAARVWAEQALEAQVQAVLALPAQNGLAWSESEEGDALVREAPALPRETKVIRRSLRRAAIPALWQTRTWGADIVVIADAAQQEFRPSMLGYGTSWNGQWYDRAVSEWCRFFEAAGQARTLDRKR